MSNQFRTDQAPLLDARLEGKFFTFGGTNDSIQYYNFSHEAEVDKVYFYGVETFCNGELGDSVDMWTEYYVPQLNEWKRYKKFGKNYMIFPNVMQKNVLFPTTPKLGVRLAIKYNQVGTGEVKFIMNMFNFVDQQEVKPSALQEGVNW